jgi:large conductance mechanosensitive channel
VLQEFKQFALRGNVVDLAIGVIIGGAFGKIVESLVGDLIMPMLSAVLGRVDFSNLFIVLGTVPAGVGSSLEALRKAGVPVLAYGSFLTVLVNFILLAFVIFILIRQINRLRSTPEPAAPAAPAAPPEDVLLLREIRDSLQQRPPLSATSPRPPNER